MYDVIIIGGGPAGMTAGIYTVRAGLKTLIIEKESIGGQLSEAPIVENYPGFDTISGFELADKMFNQATKLGVEFKFSRATDIVEKDNTKKVVLENSTELECRAVIVAAGAKNIRLNLKNENNLIGKGIHFCVSCDAAFYKDKTVAVIGGANSAVSSALYLSDIAKKVYIIYRGEDLRGEKTFNDRVKNKPNIEIIYNSCVTKINGKDHLESIVITNDNEEKEIVLDGIFESVGMYAQSDIVANLISLDERDYIESDDCKTSLPWLFVAGDCRKKAVRQISTATSDGTIAATAVIQYLR